MELNAAIRELESLGTEQARKIYKRHGVDGDLFGVSYANLDILRKKIKTDQELAEKLWATGNHDARILATMIADPSQINERLLDSWAKDLRYHVLADAFAGVAGKTPMARKKMEKWIKSNHEMIARAGWQVMAHLAMRDEELLDDYFEPHLEMIEREIHSQKNRVKEAMNGALIAIGIRNERLQEKALAAANRVGKLTVDHGETNCKTRDAAEYILKSARRKQKARSAKGK